MHISYIGGDIMHKRSLTITLCFLSSIITPIQTSFFSSLFSNNTVKKIGAFTAHATTAVAAGYLTKKISSMVAHRVFPTPPFNHLSEEEQESHMFKAMGNSFTQWLIAGIVSQAITSISIPFLQAITPQNLNFTHITKHAYGMAPHIMGLGYCAWSLYKQGISTQQPPIMSQHNPMYSSFHTAASV